MMDSQASNIDSQSASKQAADAPPFDLDQAGFKKSLTFVQEVRVSLTSFNSFANISPSLLTR